jgi:signal transduction histidine kinase/CheY-like chemotaxis protein
VGPRKARRPLPTVARPGRLQQWWLDRSVRAKGMTVVAAPLIALLGVSSASLILQANERQERQIGLASFALSNSANQLLADAVNADTGVRGYADTGDPLFLEPYNLAHGRIAKDRVTLSTAAVADGYGGQAATVEATAAKVLAELAHMRSAVSRGDLGPALRSQLKAEKATMDLLRRQVAGLAADPTADLAAGQAQIVRMESAISLVTFAGLALGIAAGMIGVALFSSGIAGRIAASAANADRLGQGLGLEPVPGADDELGGLGASLVRAAQVLASRSAELITARDEALRATQAKNLFLSSTSHELRTPLNAVLGFTQLLQLSDLGEEDRDSVERILAAGRHLLALINELIDIARIESGEFSLSVEPVLLGPLVDETCQLMTPLAAQRSITISQNCTHPGLAVRADRQRLGQILVNLASNAVKYNRNGGSLTVTCEPDGADQASLAVADTGPGISADNLERIFAPFERLGAEQTGVEGTGIGLALALAFAEAMSGRLTASSVEGEGSTFTLTLPRAPDMIQIPAQQGTDASSESLTGPVNPGETVTSILYIEDNLANIEVVARFLRSRPGLRLQSVVSGQEGLELASREIPDLILLDLHLPDLSGDEVLRQLRAVAATAGIPVAILSAEAAPAVIRDMRGRGVIAYLTKPLDLTELGQLIDSFVAGHDRETGASPGTVPT